MRVPRRCQHVKSRHNHNLHTHHQPGRPFAAPDGRDSKDRRVPLGLLKLKDHINYTYAGTWTWAQTKGYKHDFADVQGELVPGGADREVFLRGGGRVRQEDLLDVNNLQDVRSRPRPPQIQLERKTISIQIFVLP